MVEPNPVKIEKIYLQGKEREGKTSEKQQHGRTYLRRDQLDESKDDYSMSGKGSRRKK